MTYDATTNGHVIRIHADEPIKQSLLQFCTSHDIPGAFFFGIGAVKWARIGMYHMDTYTYDFQEFDSPLEITNLTGNVAYHDNELKVHAHITVANNHQHAFGGHLDEAIVEPTCEILCTSLEKPLERTIDSHSRLPLLHLSESQPGEN